MARGDDIKMVVTKGAPLSPQWDWESSEICDAEPQNQFAAQMPWPIGLLRQIKFGPRGLGFSAASFSQNPWNLNVGNPFPFPLVLWSPVSNLMQSHYTRSGLPMEAITSPQGSLSRTTHRRHTALDTGKGTVRTGTSKRRPNVGNLY